MKKKTVVHIITGLSTGGAERALHNLLVGGLQNSYENIVISLTSRGHYAALLEKVGVRVYALGMPKGLLTPQAVYQLYKVLKNFNPSIIQGWMYHGNIAAFVASLVLPSKVKFVWNIRHCIYDIKDEKRLTQYTIILGKLLSSLPSTIIFNSRLSEKQHVSFGFQSSKNSIIPNGFDLKKFCSSDEVRNRIREELGLTSDQFLIGHVARYHPMKDHETFIRAAVLLSEQFENVRFILVGSGVTDLNLHLVNMIPYHTRRNFHFLGDREDVELLYSAMELFCLSSNSEAFPNVIGEAMSSSIPCVSTDVGDVKYVIGDTGKVVSAGNHIGLASAMSDFIEKDDSEFANLKVKARERIQEHFSIDSVVSQYVQLYDELV